MNKNYEKIITEKFDLIKSLFLREFSLRKT